MSFKYSSILGLFIPSNAGVAENFLFSYRKKSQVKSSDLSKKVSKEKNPYILVVEDDEDLVNSLDVISDEKKINMVFAKSGGEGVSMLSKHNFDAVILDWNLPDFDGDELIALSDDLIKIHAKKYNYNVSYKVPVITFSGEERRNTHLDQSKYFYKVNHWKKPMSLDHIASVLEQTFHRT